MASSSLGNVPRRDPKRAASTAPEKACDEAYPTTRRSNHLKTCHAPGKKKKEKKHDMCFFFLFFFSLEIEGFQIECFPVKPSQNKVSVHVEKPGEKIRPGIHPQPQKNKKKTFWNWAHNSNPPKLSADGSPNRETFPTAKREIHPTRGLGHSKVGARKCRASHQPPTRNMADM